MSIPTTTFTQTVTPFYDWLQTAGFGGKPFMLAEYGTVERPGHPSGKADWLTTIPTQLSRLPNLRALVYFDVPHPPANCDWEIATSHASQHAFGVTASSRPLNFPRFDGHPRLASWSGRECPKWDVHRSTAKSSGPTRLRWS